MLQVKRRVLSVLGVSVLAGLSLMAFTAVSAQAQTHLWLVGGNNVTSYPLAIDGLETTGALLYKGAEIICLHTTAAGLLLNNTTAHAEILFSNCKVKNNPLCKVKEPIETEVEAKLVLLDLVVFNPIELVSPSLTHLVTNYTTLTVTRNPAILAEECLILGAGEHEEKLAVKGSTAALVEGNHLVFNKHIHELAIAAGHATGLTVGANPGVLDAKILALDTATGASVSAH